MTFFKHNPLKTMDKSSDEFKKIKEEYNSTTLKVFLAKYGIGTQTALTIFGNKTRTKEMRAKSRKDSYYWGKKVKSKIEIEENKKNVYQENTCNDNRYLDEI